MDKLTYSVAETAQVLGVSKPTVYSLIHREDFPAFRIQGRVLIGADSLKAWVNRQAEVGICHDEN